MDMHLRMWRQGETGVLAKNLDKALLLPNDMHFWEDCKDEDIALNFKWHTITVSTPLLYNHYTSIIFN